MLFTKYFPEVMIGILIYFLLHWVFSAYTYSVNLRRTTDDPKKGEYHPWAIVLAPVTLFILVGGGALLFLATALFYASVFIVFPILLVAIRKPFLLVWLHKLATRIGDPLLKVNSSLIKAFHL
ncbi:MAG TPA: hypothetical protein VIX18_03200 [Nitrospirota bacterium]